jgi:hypothetical protein
LNLYARWELNEPVFYFGRVGTDEDESGTPDPFTLDNFDWINFQEKIAERVNSITIPDPQGFEFGYNALLIPVKLHPFSVFNAINNNITTSFREQGKKEKDGITYTLYAIVTSANAGSLNLRIEFPNFE